MSLINNRNEESTPEFEVISGGKEDVRSSFADRTEEETEIDLDITDELSREQIYP